MQQMYDHHLKIKLIQNQKLVVYLLIKPFLLVANLQNQQSMMVDEKQKK
jgi:hypothetical protein